MYKSFFKPLIDLGAALVLAIILFVPFVLIGLISFIINRGGNPFFFQSRPGKNEKIFNIVKFKTMNDKKDFYGNLLPDSQRITKFGSMLRKTSLDEIPQVINILKGDMSLVGPRPLRIYYLPLYNERQKLRHNVKPGITGWAQVNGRNTISWTNKFEYDIYYVENLSFLLDVKILFKTAIKVLGSKDINASEDDTMETFNGYN